MLGRRPRAAPTWSRAAAVVGGRLGQSRSMAAAPQRATFTRTVFSVQDLWDWGAWGGRAWLTAAASTGWFCMHGAIYDVRNAAYSKKKKTISACHPTPLAANIEVHEMCGVL